MAKYQAMHGEKFVTAVVMMLEDEDEGPQVSFEPFQVSDQCVKLYSEGWFHDEPAGTSVVHTTHRSRVRADPLNLSARRLAVPTTDCYVIHRARLHSQEASSIRSRERE